jgi:hypothetical protein
VSGDIVTGAFTLGGVALSGSVAYLIAKSAAGRAAESDRRRDAIQKADALEASFAEYLGTCERTRWKLSRWAARNDLDPTPLLEHVNHQAAAISLRVPPELAKDVSAIANNLSTWVTLVADDPAAAVDGRLETYNADRDRVRESMRIELARIRAD